MAGQYALSSFVFFPFKTGHFFERLTNPTISTIMPTSGKPITSNIIKKQKPIIMISIPAYSTIKNMPLTLKASG